VLKVYIEQCGISKVFIHLLVPGVYIEQFSITKVVMQLLMPEVYTEQLGITTSRCMTSLAIPNCSI
jgi:hypothetical protein